MKVKSYHQVQSIGSGNNAVEALHDAIEKLSNKVVFVCIVRMYPEFNDDETKCTLVVEFE